MDDLRQSRIVHPGGLTTAIVQGQEIPEGYPEPAPPPSHVYVSTQGDFWDLISLRVYGMRRGDDHLMHKLIEANYPLRDVCRFPAGFAVVIPDMPVKTEIPLVPWKKALQILEP